MNTRRIVLAMTGASGMPYAVALADALKDRTDIQLHLIISEAAKIVLKTETDIPLSRLTENATAVYDQNDIAAPPASGSWIHHGMIVCPCSMASLAAIAQGFGSNLIHRAADVTLKERRKLILVPRETPFNSIHLQNMLAADRAGATVLAACPGFYHRPATIEDLTNQLAGRILDQLEVPHTLFKRWGD
ncbi:UbiX family flavin prenyltransferase [Pseudodesulfovibrio tunisiensis]|uniref:UbiX family flavin prenyltransferase n=1 Tax=Pseudodesulfovibrio tunisiensis TaxID=463192 RepID=UPI001FB4AFEF|nr:UbiX family flavin prenyltransferase [Pseudodesulfovibrio tunisiensis]